MRVLHIVESFDGQATERWLRLLANNSRECQVNEAWSFFCINGQEGSQANSVRKLGCKIVVSKFPLSRLMRFIWNLRKEIAKGRYEIIHCHHDLLSGIYLLAAIGLPVGMRVVHVHNSALVLPTRSQIKQKLGAAFLRFILLSNADRIIGVSSNALRKLVGSNFDCSRDTVVHCAIDIDQMATVLQGNMGTQLDSDASAGRPNLRNSARHAVESVLSAPGLRGYEAIGPRAVVLLFVGRMIPYKNPLHVVRILRELIQYKIDAHAIFVGDGELRSAIEDQNRERVTAGRIRCLGWRDDVGRIMNACDLLIVPSLEDPMEGLGLVVVEAQSIGLPVLVSESIPREAFVVERIVRSLPLSSAMDVWCKEALRLIDIRSTIDGHECLEQVRSSTFTPSRCLSKLVEIYSECPDVHVNLKFNE